MSATPRTPSRVPSRSGTPLPHRSPAHLASPYAIRSVSSVSSLKVYSHGTSATLSPAPGSPTSRPGGAGSGSSSSIAVEGILIQEPDAELDIIDGEQGNASGIVESGAGNEESKMNLREQLRRTLSKKDPFAGASSIVCRLVSVDII